MDYVIDPNGDGDTSDHIDIVNMSLGSVYGQPFDDDLVAAVENATKFGVFTVASAGNSSDEPYSTGTPAASASALSVAQTAVPSQVQDQMEITVPAAGFTPAVFQPWSGPLTGVIAGPVQYGDGAGGNLNGCAAFAPGSLAGQIVFVDRGACTFSAKIFNIELGGGILGIIGLIDGSTPFPGGFGGEGPPTIPGFMIDLASGNILRTGTAEVSFDPANGIPLAGSLVGSSARGPRNQDNLLKPEIGAPGASVSAEATTGVTRTPFGGTSGAAPMVSGAAALMLEQRPWAQPWLLKTLLMNNADTTTARDFTGELAEISRIGAGEVNVAAAFFSKMHAVTLPDYNAKISFGFDAVSRARQVYRKDVMVVNQQPFARTFDITSGFRYADDLNSNAIDVRHPARIRVPGLSSKTFRVTLVVTGANLPTNVMSSGGAATNPATLTAMEYDGYVTISDASESIDLPWHIIPRKSSDVSANRRLRLRNGTQDITVRNAGVGPANLDGFNLLVASPQLPFMDRRGQQEPTPDLKAAGIRATQVPATFCASELLVEFAYQSWTPQTLNLAVQFRASMDIDNDGTEDFLAFNLDVAGFLGNPGIDGRNLSTAIDQSTGDATGFFFANHATNTNTTITTFCGEQLGLTAADLGTKEITVTFSTFDYYFGGPGDEAAPVTFTLGGGYSAAVADLDPGASGTMTVTDNGGTGPNLGVMLVTDNFRGGANTGASAEGKEAVYFTPAGVQLPYGF